MDRLNYGKQIPGERQPFRTTVKLKGIAPAYALLADLQNNVPKQNHQTTPLKTPHHVRFAQSNFASPEYASLDGIGNSYLTSMNLTQNDATEIPVRHAKNESDGEKLSELDMLLEDLSNARYNDKISRRKYDEENRGLKDLSVCENSILTVEKKRPSVDSLLEELSNAHSYSIYALPNTKEYYDDQKSGKHVVITVRETTTEKIRGTPSSQYRNQAGLKDDTLRKSSSNQYTSSATRELDDLMDSLSDFKVNASTHHKLADFYPDKVKPHQGTAHFESSTTVVTTDLPTKGDQLDSMLGKLRANMSSQGVNTLQKGCCSACDKPIVGQVITALGKQFHPEHFVCYHCKEELGTRNFFERDNQPYCEQDYHNLFSPRCGYCNGPILDKCVSALDQTFHAEHFFCHKCGQQFGEDGFHEKDGKPYCRADYFDLFAPKCNGCNRAIMENYISALNSQWHPDCFVCRDCKKPVTGKSFYAMEGMPVCPSCVGVEDE
jgi:paxillin